MTAKGKVLALILASAMVMSVTSCNKEDQDETVSPESGSVDGGTVITDPDNTYFSSSVVTIPQRTNEIFTFAKGDEACIIACSYNADDEFGIGPRTYKLYVCGYDGEIRKQSEVTLPEDFNIEGACAVDDGKFAVVGSGVDFVLLDYDGKMVKASDQMSSDGDCSRCVSKTSDGFIVMVDKNISRYDSEGNFIAEIIDDNDNRTINGVFEQGGEYYGYAYDDTTTGNSLDMFYKLDFDYGSIEEHCSASELGEVRILTWYGGDYYNYCCGSTEGGELVECDMANKTTVTLADKRNMLISPPTYGTSLYVEPAYKFIDRTHFYRDYLYGEEYDIAEVALISVDNSLNLADRTELIVEGFGTGGSTAMAIAAYNYNMSQDQYFVRMEDLEGQYNAETYEDTANIYAQLLAKYSGGEAPDIFYGDFLDYNYMGENGMVLDISPYLDTSSLTDNLVRSDGKIYQVYSGYCLNGYFGRADVYGNDVSMSSMPDIPQDMKMFDMSLAADDILYNSLGSDLCSIYRRGDLTESNVLEAVKFAVKYGVSPEEQMNMGYVNTSMPSDVRNGRVSLLETSIGGASSYNYLKGEFGDYPVFVGYPSIGGSIHMVYPDCLMAVSASTQNAQACCDFISTLLSTEAQRTLCASGYIPVNNDVMAEYINILRNPDSATDEQKRFYSRAFLQGESADWQGEGGPVIPLTDEMADRYLEQVEAADMVQARDWGLYLITREEISTYYSQGKSAEEVAETLYSRYTLYAQENYN